MNTLKPLFAVNIMIGMMALTACDHPKKMRRIQLKTKIKYQRILKKLKSYHTSNMQEAKADYALPFCEKKELVLMSIFKPLKPKMNG